MIEITITIKFIKTYPYGSALGVSPTIPKPPTVLRSEFPAVAVDIDEKPNPPPRPFRSVFADWFAEKSDLIGCDNF